MSLIPAVSIKRKLNPLIMRLSSIASLVVPAISETIAFSSFSKQFNKVDFPTFGAPKIVTGIPFLITFPNLNKYINIIIKVTKRIKVNLSYFELLTAVSILYFSKAKNDINIFEVGLGGRFDATNVIKSKIGIITNVEMDHMEYLGDTIEKITYEKIGIINNEC